MATLTPFGIELRKLRLDKQMRLFDLAERLGKSTALLSAIETGRKPIPDGFITAVSRAMDLSAEQVRSLRGAKDRTRNEVSVRHLTPDQREMTAAFARRLDEFPSNFIEEIKKKVFKSCDGDLPFRRKRRGIFVDARSKSDIESFSEMIRGIFCRPEHVRVPIVEILEFGISKIYPGFVFDVADHAEMGGDEGRVFVGENTLVLRNDVYEGACNGETRPRFTACHELGHYLMHRQVKFARASQDSDPIYCDAEWQADTFAGFLMMSRQHVREFESAHDAADRCGMSVQAAKVMFAKHGRV